MRSVVPPFRRVARMQGLPMQGPCRHVVLGIRAALRRRHRVEWLHNCKRADRRIRARPLQLTRVGVMPLGAKIMKQNRRIFRIAYVTASGLPRFARWRPIAAVRRLVNDRDGRYGRAPSTFFLFHKLCMKNLDF